MSYKPDLLVKKASVGVLNEIFTPLSIEERIRTLYKYFDEDKVLFTSSFGTQSAFLLHLISTTQPSQKVHFINTTYHFKETIEYRDQLVKLLGLNIIEVLPHKGQNTLTTEEKWWEDHPKMCCTINKIAPLEPIVAKHDVWISGLKSYQTDFRSRLRVFEEQGDVIKFHPIIDVTEAEYLGHLLYHKLPRHPLESEGYGSIGCTHCTLKGKGREGRWVGKNKTECGLHPNYFIKKNA